MWLISSDNRPDGTCTVLAVTLGNIFGVKRQGNAFTRSEALPFTSSQTVLCKRGKKEEEAKRLIFLRFQSPGGQFFCSASAAVTLLFWSWQLLQSGIMVRKKQPSCDLLTSAHPRAATAQCAHFWHPGSTNSSTSAARRRRCAADVRFQSSAASVCALWGEVRCQLSNARRGMQRGTTAATVLTHTGRHCCHAASFAGITAFCKGSDL